MNTDNDSIFSNDSEFNGDNMKFINMDDKLKTRIEVDMESEDYGYEEPKCVKNGFEEQYSPMSFNNNGDIPRNSNYYAQNDVMFNDMSRNNGFNFVESSTFNPKMDGRYGVTGDMTHNNMQPYFKSKSYGFNPGRQEKMGERSTRNIDLFTGSDNMLEFRHKKEVGSLFDPVVNKVNSVTGVPNFNDFFQSRKIPSQKRDGEKPFQPVKVNPGLNLGYNERGDGGIRGNGSLYRVLPKTVDQLRTMNNPKTTYNMPIIPGQKGNKRATIGVVNKNRQDTFFENSVESMMPTTAVEQAPALHGRIDLKETARTTTAENNHINPAQSLVDKATPQELQGKFRNTFKETFVSRPVGAVSNKQQTQLVNQNNMRTEMKKTDREHNQPITNAGGNFNNVPLINFMNAIPEITKREILLADNGNKNMTNISNSVRSYLFNSVNAIPDQTLRSIITENFQITNAVGNRDDGYLFNRENAVPELNMRNVNNNIQIANQIGNSEKSYLFNRKNAVPELNMRNINNNIQIANQIGNSERSYLFNHMNAIPDPTLRNILNEAWNIDGLNFKGNEDKGYLFNSKNATPNTTIKELTEHNNNLTNILGNFKTSQMFNYKNGIPETTLREMIEKNNQILNIGNNHLMQMKLFNYDNKAKQTLRELVEQTQHLTNAMGTMLQKGKLYNFENGIPNTTLKEMTETNNNITGIKSTIMEQNRSRSDVENAYLNDVREKLLKNREPVAVKHNRGKITNLTDYTFKDDSTTCSKPLYKNYSPSINIPNELYTFRN